MILGLALREPLPVDPLGGEHVLARAAPLSLSIYIYICICNIYIYIYTHVYIITPCLEHLTTSISIVV